MRQVGQRVPEKQRECVVGDGVDCLQRTVSEQPGKKKPLRKVVSHLKENNLAVLQADKEGGFVVMPAATFDRKATEAVKKNFKQADFLPKKQKRLAVKLLKSMSLDSLRKIVESKVTSHLEIFFTGKTHKPDCPLRAILSEKDTWQKTTGNFLQSNHKR